MGKGSSGRDSSGTARSVLDNDGSKIDLSDSPLRYGKNDNSISDSVRKNVDEFEDKRRDSKVEYAHLVDANGNTTADRKGGKTSVKTSSADWKKSVLFTHVHPREAGMLGGTFSEQDFFPFAATPSVKTMRAVAKEGTYSVSKGSNYDAAGLQLYFHAEKLQLRNALVNVVNKLNAQYKSGAIDYLAYNQSYNKEFNKYLVGMHNVLLAGQKQYGYTYTLERRR